MNLAARVGRKIVCDRVVVPKCIAPLSTVAANTIKLTFVDQEVRFIPETCVPR